MDDTVDNGHVMPADVTDKVPLGSFAITRVGKASHIERFQEHAGKSSWDVIPHDA
jgi:hypothetical protein